MGNEPEITNASTNVSPEQLGGSGPSTDLNAKDFPAGTTGLDDNGNPHNIQGKSTNGNVDPWGGVGTPAPPPAAAQSNDPWGGVGTPAPPPPAVAARRDAWNQAGANTEAPPVVRGGQAVMKAIAGPGTALAAPLSPEKQKELSGVSDFLQGHFAQGAGKVWDAEVGGFHVIPGSPVEKLIQQFNPDFHGAATPEFQEQQAQYDAAGKPLIDFAQLVSKDSSPMMKAIAETASSFTSPNNIAIMVGSGGMGLIKTPAAAALAGRLISGGFAAQSLAGAYQHSVAFKEAFDKGDVNEAMYQLTHAVLGGAVTGMAGAHAAGHELAPTKESPVLNKAKDVAGNIADSVGDLPQKAGLVKPEPLDAAYKAIKPSAKSMDKFKADFQTATPDLQKFHAGTPIKTIGDLKEAIPQIKDDIWEKEVAPVVADHATEIVDMAPVRQRILDSITDESRDVNPQAADEAEKLADRLGKARTVDSGNKLLKIVNAQLDSYFAENPAARNTDLSANPKTAALEAARQGIREQFLSHLEAADEGVSGEGIRDARNRYGALSGIQGAVENAAGRIAKQTGVKAFLGAGVTPIIELLSGGAAGTFLGSPGVGTALGLGTAAVDLLRKHNANPDTLIQHAIEKGVGNPPADTAIPPAPGEPTTPVPQAPVPPTPPTPPTPAQPPMNHDLHAALSTYLEVPMDSSSPIASLQNLKQEFYSVGQRIASGEIDWPSDSPQMKAYKAMLDTVNKAEAADRTTTDKLNQKADEKFQAAKAKYDADWEKYNTDLQAHHAEIANHRAEQQKILDAAAAKQAEVAKKAMQTVEHPPKPEVEPDEDAKFGGRKPTSGPVMDANQPVRATPNLPNRRTSEEALGHEFAHGHVADQKGFNATNIASDAHPDLQDTNSAMAIGYEQKPLVNNPVELAKASADDILQNTRDWVDTYMAGAAHDELLPGDRKIKFEENKGIENDIEDAKKILRKAGVPEHQLDSEVNDGLRRAKEMLQQEGVLDSIGAEASAREDGLHDYYHSSSARHEAIRRGGKGNGNGPGNKGGTPSSGGAEGSKPAPKSGGNSKADSTPREGGEGNRGSKASEEKRRFEENNEGSNVTTTDKSFEPRSSLNKETSTGDENLDKAIKEGGAVPAGRFGPLAMFHHESGSTLAMKPEDITPESIKEHLAKKTEEYTQGDIRNAARKYNSARGLPEVNPEPVTEDPRVLQMGKVYDELQHSPNDPKVKASYDAFKNELDHQYDMLTKEGFKFDTSKEDPYPSYEAMRQDILRNKHLTAWEGAAPPADHPLAERDPKTGLTYNEKFRLVHDVLGHAAHDADFSGNGEESAWNYHRQMFSPEAQPALAGETRGQVASYTRNGKFPETQKAVIMPEEYNTRPEDQKAGKSAPEGRSSLSRGRVEGVDHDEVLDNMKRAYGTSKNAKDMNRASFITPEGDYIHLPEGTAHTDAIEEHGGPGTTTENGHDNRPQFMEDTGTVRIHKANGRAGETMHISVPPQGATEGQVDSLKKSMAQTMGRNGNIMMERSDISADNADKTHASKDFASANDIEPLLRKIGALKGERSSLTKAPEENDNKWANKVVKGLGTEKGAAGGIDPETGSTKSKRYGFEIHPESRMPLESNPTAEQMAQHAADTKDIRALHPDMKLGWDTTGAKPELNTGASTDNLEAAMEMAKKLDQRSIWDNKEKKEIPVGGTGNTTEFPDYPMEQRVKDLQDAEDFKNLPKDIQSKMEPDELESLRGRPQLQKNVQEEYNNIDPSIKEIINAAKAGQGLGGWWKRFMETFKAMGEPDEASKINQLGPSHEEALKAFHGALSGNKAVEHANKLAWNAYRDWLDAGRPRDRESVNKIIAQNGADKGVAAISDTHNTTDKPYKVLDKKGKPTGEVIPPGGTINQGLDTTKMTKLVNSPQMRDVNPVPFTGNAFLDSPVEGVSSGAKKIPSMVATTAGTGNLNRVVFDTHMKDIYGQAGLTDAKYIADSIHIREAAKAMGLSAGEAQEQIWGTVLALKGLLGEGLSPEDAAEQFGDEHVAGVAKDYAQVILNQLESDPSFRETLDGLSKHGFNPTSPKAIAKLREIVAEGQSRIGQTDPASIDRELLAKSADRLGKGIKGYDAEKARQSTRFDFGANENSTNSALDTIAGKK